MVYQMLNEDSDKSNMFESKEAPLLQDFRELAYECFYFLGIPSWLGFSLIDAYCYPEKWLPFFISRCLVVFTFFCSVNVIQKHVRNVAEAQWLITLTITIMISVLTWMIFETGGSKSFYWCDINLICVACLVLFPWTRGFLALNCIITYAPFYLGVMIYGVSPLDLRDLAANSAFNFCMLGLSLGNYHFSNRLRKKQQDTEQRLKKEIDTRDHQIREKTKEALGLEMQAHLGRQGAQIAHDIRSPLAALNAVTSDVQNLPENQRLVLRSAVSRITKIADGLMEQSLSLADIERNFSERLEKVDIFCVVREMIAEKEAEFRTHSHIKFLVDLPVEFYGSFAHVNENNLKRVLSNLVNNSVEALFKEGSIAVRMGRADGLIVIEISDTGVGIPQDVLPKLGQRGGTFGKKGGLGLGLFFAQSQVKQWGGEWTIQSIPQQGTTVKITLREEVPPIWFVQEICMKAGSTVVVVDDERSLHLTWDYRFSKSGIEEYGIKCLHFFHFEQLREFSGREKRSDRSVLYLVDYEINTETKLNGIEIIQELGLKKNSVLVTNRYQDAAVLNSCISLGLKVLPKVVAGLVPIRIEP